MSDEFDSTELPDELRDVANQLRGLRPVAANASEGQCMYRAGWEAALAANAPAVASAWSWNRNYVGGLLSGALVSSAVAAALLLSLIGPRAETKAVPRTDTVAVEADAPTSSLTTDAALMSGLPDEADARGSLPPNWSVAGTAETSPSRDEPPLRRDRETTPAYNMADGSMSPALLSRVARRQWRQELTRAAAAYASPRTDEGIAGEQSKETLRSSPRGILPAWF